MREHGPETIGLDVLKGGLADGSIVLVDVREAHEFAAGHIPGSVNMPLSSFDPGQLPPRTRSRLVLSCQSGKRSRIALERAQQDGRDDTTQFEEGFAGWVGAGEPVNRG